MSVNLNADIGGVMRSVEKEVGQVTRKAGIDTLSGVVLKTPVDTGRARANWNVSLDVPDTSTTDATDKSGRRTITEGEETIASAGSFPVIWLTNNLPYIGVLEDGSSQQAPNGMASVTAAEVTERFKT